MDSEITKEDRTVIEEYYRLYSNGTKCLAGTYDSVAPIYDRVIRLLGHDMCAKRIAEALQNSYHVSDLSKLSILDVGCGTGLLGERLSRNGFSNLYGLEISSRSIEIAQQKKIYKEIYNVPLTPKPTDGINDNTFDGAVSGGCFIPDHIPLDAIREIIRMVKKDGYIIFTLDDPGYKSNYMHTLGELIKNSIVQLSLMEFVPYKRDFKKNFELVFAYIVVLKVL